MGFVLIDVEHFFLAALGNPIEYQKQQANGM